MDIWLECIIGALASAGLVCILKVLYDIIFKDCPRARAELFLYANGTDPSSAELLRTAEQVRRLYFPNLHIIFVENGEADPQSYNIARALCERKQVEYIE